MEYFLPDCIFQIDISLRSVIGGNCVRQRSVGIQSSQSFFLFPRKKKEVKTGGGNNVTSENDFFLFSFLAPRTVVLSHMDLLLGLTT